MVKTNVNVSSHFRHKKGGGVLSLVYDTFLECCFKGKHV